MEKNVIWPCCQTQTIYPSACTEMLNTTGCGTWNEFGSEILLVNQMCRYGCERRGGQFAISSTRYQSHCDMPHTVSSQARLRRPNHSVSTIPWGRHEMPVLKFVLDLLAVLLLIIDLIYCMFTDRSSRYLS
jgi:hypothetical protein